MASAEVGLTTSGVGGRVRGGVFLPSRLGSMGERRELPHRHTGQSPGRKRILAYFESQR